MHMSFPAGGMVGQWRRGPRKETPALSTPWAGGRSQEKGELEQGCDDTTSSFSQWQPIASVDVSPLD